MILNKATSNNNASKINAIAITTFLHFSIHNEKLSIG